MTSATRSKKASRGFTLIELIAVLVLVGLLLVFSPLGIQSLVPERELQAEASRLGTTIRMLRDQAMLDQAPYAMHYDTEKDRWAYQEPEEVTQPNPDGSDEPVKALLLDDDLDFEALDWHRLPQGVSLELYEGSKRISGRFMVTFSPRGTVPPHTLILKSDRVASLDEEESTRTVKVNFPGIVSFAVGRVVEEFKKTEAELGR